MVQGVDNGEFVFELTRNAKVFNDELQELHFGKTRIENDRGFVRCGIQTVEQGPAEGGFAGADFAGDEDNAFALIDAVEQMGEGVFVFDAVEKEGRIRSNIEGKFGEFIKILIHPNFLSDPNSKEKLG